MISVWALCVTVYRLSKSQSEGRSPSWMRANVSPEDILIAAVPSTTRKICPPTLPMTTPG